MKELAECIGLWLAEGDNKTNAEITFTNNCLELILFFQQTIKKIYKGNNKPRLYIYSSNKRKLIKKLNGFKWINYYIDKRANKPYYIYRLADVEFVKIWKNIVDNIKQNKNFYADILRGLFAGEGNINHRPQCNNHRSIRISSKPRNEFIEKVLTYFKINYKYNRDHREYSIYGSNLDKVHKINISSLHPEKEYKFNKMIFSIKEKHYPKNYLKKAIHSKLIKIYTAKKLAKIFNRDFTRIQEVLSELKKENKIKNIRFKNKSVWAKNKVVRKYLSNKKIKLLKAFNKAKTIKQLSQNINLGHKAIRRRFKSLQREDIIQKKDGRWKLTEKGNMLICGIDESGRFS